MNHDVSTYMTHPFSGANTSETDPVVERFGRDASAPSRFWNLEIITRLRRRLCKFDYIIRRG